ncbi:MAG: hypothetical protein R3C30_13840 [Hyphomonadaceae bacterium]
MSEASKTPWHLWLVGGVGILWNGYGAFDFFSTQTRGDAYLRELGMNDAAIAYYNAMPWWMIAIWAVRTIGALIATILLLMRSKWAFEVFIASFAGFLLSLVYAYVLSDAPDSGDDTSMMIMNVVIAAGCVFFIWYSWLMKKRGVLR